MAKKAKKTKAKPTKKKPKSYKLSKQNKIIFGSLLILASIFLTLAFISFYFNWKDDQSLLTEFGERNEEAKNLLRKTGAHISHFFMYKGFGLTSFTIPALLCLKGLYMFLGLGEKGMLKKWIWGLVFMIWTSIAFGFFGSSQPLLGGLVGYEMNDFLQDYIGMIGVLLLLLFGLVFILVRLFQFSPEDIGSWFKNKTNSLKTDFKGSSKTEEIESSMTLSLEPEDDTPIVIDTYTHKEDIPPLVQETVDDFEVKVPVEEEELAMEVKEIVEEKEEKKNIADKLVDDF